MEKLQELFNLSGKVAIVTGAANGIGKGIAYRLAEAGAKVLIADLDKDAAKQAATELTNKGWEAVFMGVDVSNEDSVKALAIGCKQHFRKIDILVNNAGIYPAMPIAQMTSELFDKVISVNLRSVFLTTKYVSEVMKESGNGGKIINVSSIDAIHPSMIGLAHYDASKHGVWGFTKNAALELAKDKIWVNAIAPGGIDTPGARPKQTNAVPVDPAVMQKMAESFMAKIPMGRQGEPDDIGKVALFLASDLSSYMTGTQIVVDGGYLLS